MNIRDLINLLNRIDRVDIDAGSCTDAATVSDTADTASDMDASEELNNPEGASDSDTEFVPPLQSEIEILRRIAGLRNVYEPCQSTSSSSDIRSQ